MLFLSNNRGAYEILTLLCDLITMGELLKMLKTLNFITAAFIRQVPPAYTFKCENRKEFARCLDNLKGKDFQSSAWLTHLKQVNCYCDENKLDLLEPELKGLQEIYNAAPTTVHEALEKEKEMFGRHTSLFEEDTLAYDLRKYRPNPCFLPDGDIALVEKAK